MKRNIGKRINANIRSFKEDLQILQKQIQGRSVYAKDYAYNYRKNLKHRKNIYTDLEGSR